MIDRATGRPLTFEVVSGAEARNAGLANADLEGEYIKVTLARPVADRGSAHPDRQDYKDPKSYFGTEDHRLRPSARHPAQHVVLPAGTR